MKRLPILSLADVFPAAEETLWRMGDRFLLFVQVQFPSDWELVIAQTHGVDDALLVLGVRLGRFDVEQDQWVEQREVGITSRTALQQFRAETGVAWKVGALPCRDEFSGRFA